MLPDDPVALFTVSSFLTIHLHYHTSNRDIFKELFTQSLTDSVTNTKSLTDNNKSGF